MKAQDQNVIDKTQVCVAKCDLIVQCSKNNKYL